MGIYAALSDKPVGQVCAEFGGKQFSEFKQALIDLMVATLVPMQNEMRRLMADPASVDKIVHDGAERAKAIAEPILRQVKDIVGFLRA